MPTLGILLILNSDSSFSLMSLEAKRLIFYATLLITCILPLIFLSLLKLNGYIKSYKLRSRNERFIPILLINCIYLTGFYFFSRFSFVPGFIKIYTLAIFITALLTLFINLKSKISLHMVGIGGITGILLSLIWFNSLNLHIYIISAILLSGIIGYSRLRLNEHVPSQIYIGYFTGLITLMFLLVILN